MLSLGLAVIFGMLNVVNFAHGAQYMMGAFGAWLLLPMLGIPLLVRRWSSSPMVVGLFGIVARAAAAAAHSTSSIISTACC